MNIRMLIIWRDNLNYQLLDVENVSLQKSSSASIQFPGRRLFPLSSEWSSRNLKEELDLKEESESDSDRMHPNPKFVSAKFARFHKHNNLPRTALVWKWQVFWSESKNISDVSVKKGAYKRGVKSAGEYLIWTIRAKYASNFDLFKKFYKYWTLLKTFQNTDFERAMI